MGLKIGNKIYQINKSTLAFWCPACESLHPLNIDPAKGHPLWLFNNHLEQPGFHPSVNATGGHYVPKPPQPQPPDCESCNMSARDGHETLCFRCHSWVRDGMIQFLNDCTHKLAGQTVPIPDLPPRFR